MPVCHRCCSQQASAEVRGTQKGHVCKDKTACAKRRERLAQAIEKGGSR
jgi:hypothetical protein